MAYKQYLKEIHAGTGYIATWLPSTSLAVGDIGTFKDGQFHRKANLSDLDISFEVKEKTESAPIKFVSKGGVQVRTKAGGDVPGANSSLAQADAEIEVRFSKDQAVLFQAAGCRSLSISNQLPVRERMLELHAAGSWPLDQVLVTEIIKADTATILISKGNNSAVDLKLSGQINEITPLASANVQYQQQNESSMGFVTVANEGLTPLSKICGIKKPFLVGKPRIVERSSGAPSTYDLRPNDAWSSN